MSPNATADPYKGSLSVWHVHKNQLLLIPAVLSRDARMSSISSCLSCSRLYTSSKYYTPIHVRISTVSEPAHLVAHQRTQHSIVVRPTAVRAISTDIICQTIVSTAAPLTWNSLPPAALNCDSLLSNPDLKLICFLLLSANYSTYLFQQRLCSRIMALWRFINLVLLLLLILLLLILNFHVIPIDFPAKLVSNVFIIHRCNKTLSLTGWAYWNYN